MSRWWCEHGNLKYDLALYHLFNPTQAFHKWAKALCVSTKRIFVLAEENMVTKSNPTHTLLFLRWCHMCSSSFEKSAQAQHYCVSCLFCSKLWSILQAFRMLTSHMHLNLNIIETSETKTIYYVVIILHHSLSVLFS